MPSTCLPTLYGTEPDAEARAGKRLTYNAYMEKLGYAIVPRNREGMVGQMAGNADVGDLIFFPFTQAEMNAVAPLLSAFERAFGFDAKGGTVEQLIDTRFATMAEDMAREAAASANGEVERTACIRMADALAAALETGSYMELAFD